MKTTHSNFHLIFTLLTTVFFAGACTDNTDASAEDHPDESVASVQQASTAPVAQQVFAMGHSIYVVTRDAELLWYGDVTQNGTPGWAAGSGNLIGEGWNSIRLVFAGGAGIIYAVDNSGYLHWYKDVYQNGT